MKINNILQKNEFKINEAVKALEEMGNFMISYEENMTICEIQFMEVKAMGPTEEEAMENARIQAKALLIQDMASTEAILKEYKEKNKKKLD